MRASVRFLISVTLLLSALNGIVLLSATLALLSSATELEDRPDHAATEELSSCYEEILGGTEGDACLDELEPLLAQLGPQADASLSALAGLRHRVDEWEAASHSPESLRRLSDARYLLAGTIYVEHDDDGITEPALWALLVWVCVATVLTLVVASQLRAVITVPLNAVAAAAARVAGGDLSTPIPEVETGHEIAGLARSVESMRRNLVRSIGRAEDERAVVRSMLDALKDGVILLDQRRRLVGFNPAATRLVAAINRMSLRDGAPVRSVLPMLEEELLLNSHGGKQEVDLDHGPVRHVTLHSVPMERLGPDREPGYVLIVRDVTRSVQVENLKREFLSVVTHELKTPLTSVKGFVKLLLMGKGGPLTDKQAELLGRTQDQADLLGSMIQDLLDATRLEGGQLTLDLAELDVKEAVHDAVAAFSGEAETQGIHLSGQSEALQAWGDPFRLQQILGNLIRNAIKFTPSGGKVTVRAVAALDEVEITVSDTGRGIAAQDQEHLFRKFFQVEQGDKRRSGGAGLGLYICSELSKQMGGSIRCRSALGQGSHFTVTLSRSKE